MKRTVGFVSGCRSGWLGLVRVSSDDPRSFRDGHE